jgi:hypothetical protein
MLYNLRHFRLCYSGNGRPGSSVGIVTGYGLDGPGIEIFRTCPDRFWGPPSLLYNGYRVFPGVKERPGRDADRSPPSSATGHERVELYLYSPDGPYGLYRPSLSACTRVHFTLLRQRHLYPQIRLSIMKQNTYCMKKAGVS